MTTPTLVMNIETRDFRLDTLVTGLGVDRWERNVRRAKQRKLWRRVRYWNRVIERHMWSVELGDPSRHEIMSNWEEPD